MKALPAKLGSTLPWLSLLALVSGMANAVVIFSVTATLEGRIAKESLVLFVFAVGVYLAARRTVERRLIELSSDALHEIRTTLLRRILRAPFETFERIERGKIYAVVCDDTRTLGNAASLSLTLITSLVTLVTIFVYLIVIDPLLAMIMGGVVAAIAFAYERRTASVRGFFERARSSWSRFVGCIHEALDGMKELAVHRPKRNEFQAACERQSDHSRRDSASALFAHLDAFLFGEFLLLGALGGLALSPLVFLSVDLTMRTRFLIVLLYAIGPVRAILGAVPVLAQARVAWHRISSLPLPEADESETSSPVRIAPPVVGKLELVGLAFQYGGIGSQGLCVGPVDVSVSCGECLFLTGGNGSGKTTLAKMMTGLYGVAAGEVRIDGRRIRRNELGEYFSVVFNPCFLFDGLYGVEPDEKKIDLALYRLDLAGKVARQGSWIDPIRLSSGQRKRVALLESRLQDRPIFLFDEVTADQDSEFRRFFYEEFLDELRSEGRIVIVITHDEKYFHVADRLIKLDLGQVVTDVEPRECVEKTPWRMNFDHTTVTS